MKLHGQMDGLSRWTRTSPGVSCLLPWTGARFQQEGPVLLPGLVARGMSLAPGQAVLVGSLGWSASPTTFGTGFHPMLRRFGMSLTPDAQPDGLRDLYVLRDDAGNRPLRNEAAVARLCQEHGFAPVRLSGLPMRDQVALFRGARRIVAPHGAGLANLVFARPGCALLELHMDAYVNWCFRRLSATMQVRYGCVIGSAEAGADYIHHRGWTVDLDRLRAALRDPAFMES